MCKHGTHKKVNVIYRHNPFVPDGWYEKSIDACIADEIQDLNDNGIKTINCCCGHNGEGRPNIIVFEEFRQQMIELGYEIYPFQDANDCFEVIPKTYMKGGEVRLEQVFLEGKWYAEINGSTSDGYHTFYELYDHRITLYIALCREIHARQTDQVWRSHVHSDDSVMPGWFILGMNEEAGEQITYHLPLSKWDECDFAVTLEKAPEYDGHTSEDVLNRIKNML